MCLHTKRMFSYHTNYNFYSHIYRYECNFCHNYIRCYDSNLDLDKEIFFILNCNVIMTSDEVLLERKDCKDIILPFFIFSGEADLIKKVKIYTLIS